MKRILLAMSFGCTILTVSAQQLRTPAPSPGQTIKQDFGLSSIELSYSRPGVKNRKIFGDVRPYGVIWRTGANGATTLTFGDDVNIGGTLIKAGKYGLLTLPNKDNWVLIITKQLDVTSPDAYKQDQDVVRVNAKPMTLKEPVETFTMQFANVKQNSCDLQLMWENTGIILPITTDIDTKVVAQIKTLLENDSRPYYNAALYYLENGKDLNQALTWFDKAIEQTPKAFWVWHQKANCLAKMGKKEEARTTAMKSIELAKEAKNDDYVALNEKLIATLK
jgi:tetratricopeptide (TPR) repeat protein